MPIAFPLAQYQGNGASYSTQVGHILAFDSHRALLLLASSFSRTGIWFGGMRMMKPDHGGERRGDPATCTPQWRAETVGYFKFQKVRCFALDVRRILAPFLTPSELFPFLQMNPIMGYSKN